MGKIKILTKARINKFFYWINEYAHPLRVIGVFLFMFALLLGIFWMIGFKTDAAAYLLQMLSTLLFALPSVAQYCLSIKPIKDMSFDEILSFIVKTSPKNDWKVNQRDYLTEAFLNIDPRLRFRIRYTEDGVQNEKFEAQWANCHPDQRAMGYWCDLIYNGDFLDRTVLVSVDGGRSNLPIPKINTNLIEKYSYHVAQIFDIQNTLDEYIQRGKLNVSNV